MTLIDILNYQPLGDHGVHSLLSVRMFHVFMVCALILIHRQFNKEDKE